MDILLFVLFLLVSIIALVSLLFGVPGNFIVLAASVLYGWYGGFEQITVRVVIILACLALFAELLEFVLGIAGAKKWKSSNKALIGSFVLGIFGAIAGAPFFFGAGAVVGAFAGAFLGAYIVDYFMTKDSIRALHSGVGALIGKVGGFFAKGFITVAMIVISLASIINNW